MAELDSPRRLGAFDDVLLGATEDATLQTVVRATAMATGTPIALVSLVTGRIQWFRAHTGLPTALATSRATSRCDSFCQFVVQDEAAFEVQDATTHERVPQRLVSLYGIRAYLGAPVRYRGEVVGSFCVIDIVPRAFTAEHRTAVADAALAVSERLEELRRTRSVPGLPPLPTLSAVRDRTQSLRLALAELAAVHRLVSRADTLPPDEAKKAFAALHELEDLHGSMEAVAGDIVASLDSIIARSPKT